MGNSNQSLLEKSHVHLPMCLSALPQGWGMSAKLFLIALIQNRRAIRNCPCLCNFMASVTCFLYPKYFSFISEGEPVLLNKFQYYSMYDKQRQR